jgi:hypothetical protein
MSPNRRRTAALAAGAAAAALLLLFHNGGGGGGGHLEYVLTRRNLQYLDSPSRFTEPLPVKESLKKNKIYFVKTHKCASSSVQVKRMIKADYTLDGYMIQHHVCSWLKNILLRHAMAENLTVALSSVGNYLGRHMPFRRSMLAATPWEAAGLSYDIFCLHHIFNKEEVSVFFVPGFFLMFFFCKKSTFFHFSSNYCLNIGVEVMYSLNALFPTGLSLNEP